MDQPNSKNSQKLRSKRSQTKRHSNNRKSTLNRRSLSRRTRIKLKTTQLREEKGDKAEVRPPLGENTAPPGSLSHFDARLYKSVGRARACIASIYTYSERGGIRARTQPSDGRGGQKLLIGRAGHDKTLY